MQQKKENAPRIRKGSMVCYVRKVIYQTIKQSPKLVPFFLRMPATEIQQRIQEINLKKLEEENEKDTESKS